MVRKPNAITVREIMVRNPAAVLGSTPVRAVVRRMAEAKIGALLVEDQGQLLGIFTERDVVRMHGADLSLDESVDKHMTRNPTTIAPGMDINAALQLMKEKKIRHFPVVDDDKVVGIVSMRDFTHALEMAKDAAEALAESKDEFLANMSHEIRTPLTGVLGMAALLGKTALPPKSRSYVKAIESSGLHLLKIINDILDWSKIQAGRLELERVPFSIRPFLEELTQTFQPACAVKQIDLSLILHADIPQRSAGDPTRLRIILANLISNALKFTRKGRIAIRASVIDGSASSDQMRFEVEDTGVGIREEDQGKLFTAFSQADTSITRKYGGTGLGLTISKHLVDLMAGEMGFKSAYGEGSTFWIEVPLGKSAPIPEVIESPLGFEGRRVLVVDDTSTNRVILKEQLAQWGMVATCVENTEVEECLQKGADVGAPFDLAIIDMQMPSIDGLTLGRQIKQDARWNKMPCIMITSSPMRGQATEAREAGYSAYLVRPPSTEDLHDCVDTVLKSADESGEIREPTFVTRHTIMEMRSQRQPRILLAEDNPINQHVLVEMLQHMGYRVEIAQDGEEVLSVLERNPYQAILMDVEMPRMDGLKTTQAIRGKKDPSRGIPIIGLTARSMAGDRERCLAAGMDDYLWKPVRMEDLDAALRRWIDARPTSDRKKSDHQSQKNETQGQGDGPLDTEVLGRLRALYGTRGEEALPRLINLFFEEAYRALGEMREALDQGDGERVGGYGHRMKSSAGYIGARNLKKHYAKIEELSAGGSTNGFPEIFKQIEAELGRFRVECLEQVPGVSDSSGLPMVSR